MLKQYRILNGLVISNDDEEVVPENIRQRAFDTLLNYENSYILEQKSVASTSFVLKPINQWRVKEKINTNEADIILYDSDVLISNYVLYTTTNVEFNKMFSSGITHLHNGQGKQFKDTVVKIARLELLPSKLVRMYLDYINDWCYEQCKPTFSTYNADFLNINTVFQLCDKINEKYSNDYDNIIRVCRKFSNDVFDGAKPDDDFIEVYDDKAIYHTMKSFLPYYDKYIKAWSISSLVPTQILYDKMMNKTKMYVKAAIKKMKEIEEDMKQFAQL